MCFCWHDAFRGMCSFCDVVVDPWMLAGLRNVAFFNTRCLSVTGFDLTFANGRVAEYPFHGITVESSFY